MKGKALNSRSVNDGKVTDHHALIVTENLPDKMEADEQVIYELIAGRMLEAFSEKCVKDVTSVTLECAGSLFTVKGSVIKSAGWRAVFGEKEDGEDNAALPAMQDGDSLPLSGIELLEKQTKPKPLHTESSLLSSMETAGKELENADLKASMKDTGMARPQHGQPSSRRCFPASISSGRKRTLSLPRKVLPFTTSSGTRR